MVLNNRISLQILQMYVAPTVPNSLQGVPYVWVPVGLIDERLEMECAETSALMVTMPGM